MITAIIFFVVLLVLIQTSRLFCADFDNVNIVLSTSCHTVSIPAPNIGDCFQSCVNIGSSLYMSSQHVLNKECVCCQLPLLTDIRSSLYMVSQHAFTNECVCCQLPLLSDTEHNKEWRSFVREFHTKSLH